MNRLRRRLGRLHEERGQILAVYVLALPASLAVAALALDGGKLFVNRLHLQNASDAASLASVRDVGVCVSDPTDPACLPGSSVQGQVEADVNCYAHYNDAPVGDCLGSPEPHIAACTGSWYSETDAERAADSNCYMWPYVRAVGADPEYDKVEVRLRKTVSLNFGGLPFIPNDAHPWARAVATFKADVVPGTEGTTTEVVSGTNPDDVIPGSTTVETTVIDGTTVYDTVTEPDQTVPTTTVIPGETHTTTTTTGGTGAVAFAMSSDCRTGKQTAAIEWSGSQSALKSLVTNGGINVAGNQAKSSDHIMLGRFGDPGCQEFFSKNWAADASFPDVSKLPGAPLKEWPITPPDKPSPCASTGTDTVGGGWTTNHSPGVYCWTGGTLTFADNGGVYRGYTFFAPSISISSKNMTMQHAAGTTTLFEATTGNFSMTGSDNSLDGYIFAPNGTIDISGGGATSGTGFMEAQKLVIAGNFADYSGEGPLFGGTTTVLTTTDPDQTVATTTVISGTTTVLTSVTGGTTTLNTTTSPDTTVPGSTYTVTTVRTTTSPGTTATTGTQGLGE